MSQNGLHTILLSASLAAIAPGFAIAGDSFGSDYTTIDIKKCRVVEKASSEGEYSGTSGCKGFKGKPDYEITMAEGDLRGLVAFGKNGKTHCSFRSPFGHFNSAGNTVEWRLKNNVPFAAIQRWTVNHNVDKPEDTKPWLVVTKLENGNSCHMAFVEGALAKANEKARMIADKFASDFSCATASPQIISNADTKTDYLVVYGCPAQ